MNSTAPNTAQLTVISGRKMPRFWYSDSETRSTIISTSCTEPAMTMM